MNGGQPREATSRDRGVAAIVEHLDGLDDYGLWVVRAVAGRLAAGQSPLAALNSVAEDGVEAARRARAAGLL